MHGVEVYPVANPHRTSKEYENSKNRSASTIALLESPDDHRWLLQQSSRRTRLKSRIGAPSTSVDYNCWRINLNLAPTFEGHAGGLFTGIFAKFWLGFDFIEKINSLEKNKCTRTHYPIALDFVKLIVASRVARSRARSFRFGESFGASIWSQPGIWCNQHRGMSDKLNCFD